MTRRNVLVVNERVECPRCNADLRVINRYEETVDKDAEAHVEAGHAPGSYEASEKAILFAFALVVLCAIVAFVARAVTT